MDQTARLEAHALVERLVADGDTFDPADAATLVELIPCAERRRTPFASLGLRGRLPGGRMSGRAAGVGDISIQDDRGRDVSCTSDGLPVWRVGAYKVMHVPGTVTIEDALERAEPLELAAGVQRGRCELRYGPTGPEAIYQEEVRSVTLLGFLQVAKSTFVVWKRPAATLG
jgi:hypothetical protein